MNVFYKLGKLLIFGRFLDKNELSGEIPKDLSSLTCLRLL